MEISSIENRTKTAIVVVGYNRINSIKRLLASLEKAYYPDYDIPLVISIDASGNDLLYRYVQNYEWKFGTKYVLIRSERLGLKNHIFACGDLTQYFKAIILLEDDLYVSQYFYEYTSVTLDYYKDEKEVACIGLYSYTSNVYSVLPFIPYQGEYDVYGIQATITWGECWNTRMWSDFKNWMKQNPEIDWDNLDIPNNVKNFNRAWSKYFTAYLSVTSRFVIAPYKSYTTNFSEAGEHRNYMDTCVQVPIVRRKEILRFGSIDKIQKYDAYFNPLGLDKFLNIESLYVDFYSMRSNILNCRYLLTLDILPYKQIKSFGLILKPIEANIYCGIEGSGIYLYDLSEIDRSVKVNKNPIQSIDYRLQMFRPSLLKKFLLNYAKIYFFKKLGLRKK